ncbi:Nif3-like dinuclear metal center hexameric protein [Echinimonas agarilytica]|uniref:GTP cyclohydrolase 1 type 2 homolog n=1 Tax=Echinimonas agarilytica TaxID=1215918 RepID=A0AA41W6Q8_9GAMM|nr:Nif3-like dinuclear metal center hexameric protein [Echinimonas agarilytica]MCM2679977.1 Nif3-like dinuclear metal center hexameric protein [Echinimonas agarilytica]
MLTTELVTYLDQTLQSNQIRDFCPNGLQVQGKPNIQSIVAGVTASQALVDEAIARNADAVLVHHGYFWKNEPAAVVGMKYNRLKALLTHDINLIAYHLPLDVHAEHGNNAQLAKRLGIVDAEGLDPNDPFSVAMQGRLAQPVTGAQLAERIAQSLNRTPVFVEGHGGVVQKVGWCTGGGQSYIDQAVAAGCDAFITGEASEQTVHVAREMGIDFIAAGHHATERYGALALGRHIAEKFDLNVEFVDIDNPV